MDNEISSIEKNQTWELIDLPIGAKTIGVKWIYKTRLNELGEVDKYKACLWLRGTLNNKELILLKSSHLLHAWILLG